jgi:hypothetical protein
MEKKLGAILVGGAVAAALFDFLIGPLVGGLLTGYLLSGERTNNVKMGAAAGIVGVLLYSGVSVSLVLLKSNTLTDIIIFDSLSLLGAGALLLTFSMLTSAIGCIISGKLSSASKEDRSTAV